ncbi:N-acetylmuramic acid 6-phosphate etherase [Enemella dayhoffiae]|uniref:N-acetylmuramic acid 6-phosphate etherase n=1 Tax=Enemella dayhoffiae TaxID=2016507 RepID=A0A255GYK1_9ACTN|nr:N-acetylmuramic acid 6-phosphate etherase [Enemella dayhoffiae]OYO18714.1 N-acetylmuramic acid 6-phosphate etherase [Enemella dayhoffiae]
MTNTPLTWSTEQVNPRSIDLDTKPTEEVVRSILAEDETVAAAVSAVGPQIARAVDLAVAALSAGGRIHYVGSGTSGRMGVLDAVELLPTYRVGDDKFTAHLAGGPGAMSLAVEGAEDDPEAGAAAVAEAGPNDLVIGLAASGRTPYVGGALAAARERGLPTVLIAANPNAPLAEHADVAVLADTGPEVITGSTRMKAASAQKMILNSLSTAAMVRLGKVYSNLMIDMMPTNEKLRARSVRMLVQGSGADEQRCAEVLAQAGGEVRLALTALLADVPVAAAREALAACPAAADRPGDPTGIRTAVQRLRDAARKTG